MYVLPHSDKATYSEVKDNKDKRIIVFGDFDRSHITFIIGENYIRLLTVKRLKSMGQDNSIDFKFSV